MNVRIFWVRVMKCMCAQTRPRFILSSEGVLGGMEFEPMLTPREKSPLPEKVPRGGSNPRRCGQRAQALPTELFRPPDRVWNCIYSSFFYFIGYFIYSSFFVSFILLAFLFHWLFYFMWLIKPMKEGRKPEYPEKTPDNELQEMQHTEAWRFKP